MRGSPRTYRAILSYCLQRPGKPVDVRTMSTVIGASAQQVQQACEVLVRAGVLVHLGPADAPRPLFQCMAEEIERAQRALAEGKLIPQRE